MPADLRHRSRASRDGGRAEGHVPGRRRQRGQSATRCARSETYQTDAKRCAGWSLRERVDSLYNWRDALRAPDRRGDRIADVQSRGTDARASRRFNCAGRWAGDHRRLQPHEGRHRTKTGSKHAFDRDHGPAGTHAFRRDDRRANEQSQTARARRGNSDAGGKSFACQRPIRAEEIRLESLGCAPDAAE